jgi:hypothetical protein
MTCFSAITIIREDIKSLSEQDRTKALITLRVIRRNKSKDTQYNGQRKKDDKKKTNNKQ